MVTGIQELIMVEKSFGRISTVFHGIIFNEYFRKTPFRNIHSIIMYPLVYT
jgi:hypothetical protein